MCAILTAAFFWNESYFRPATYSSTTILPRPSFRKGWYYSVLTIFCLTGYIVNPTPACDRGINLAHHPLYSVCLVPLRAQKHRGSSPTRAMCCDGDILGTSVHLQDSGLTSSVRYVRITLWGQESKVQAIVCRVSATLCTRAACPV